MVYLESRKLYIDFMLNKFSRDDFLEHISQLPERERETLFSMSKMQIFRHLYEARIQEDPDYFQASA